MKKNYLNQFKKNGFVKIENFFDIQQIKKVQNLIYNIGFDESKSDIYYEKIDGINKIRRVENLSKQYAEFDNLAYGNSLSEYLFEIFGEKALIFKEKLNFKPSNGSGVFRMHVDGHYDWIDKENNLKKGWSEYGKYFVNVVIPIEPSDRSNGCLYVCHKDETKKFFGNNWNDIKSKLDGNGPYLKRQDENKVKKIYIEQKPTDLLLFDWRCIHGSESNYTNNERPILYLTYNGESDGDNLDKYYHDKKHSKGSLKDKSLNS